MAANEDFIIFQNETYLDEFVPIMIELRQLKKFCDVKLKISNKTIDAHRLVLASSIPYFYTMFTSDMAECRLDEIEMNEVDPDAFHDLINYAYSGKIKIDTQNAINLLVGASYLQMTKVLKACEDFLKTHLQFHNVLSIRKIADSLDCNDLKNDCSKFIQKYFTKISKTSEFLCLDFEELLELVKKDDLQVESEEVIFDACIKWIKFDEVYRKKLFSQILSEIRIVFLPNKYIDERVICGYFLESSNDCNKLLDEAKVYMAMPKLQGYKQNHRTKPRCYLGYMYVLCGYENDAGWPVNSLEYYDPYEEKWNLGEKVTVNRKYFGVAGLDNKLYAIGGEMIKVFVSSGYGSEALQIVEVYDPIKKQWTKVPEMNNRRKSPGVVAYNNCLYVCGGTSGSVALNRVEFYSPELETWQSVSPMAQGRRRCGTVALNGYIYVLGGFGLIEALDTVERYDPETDSWEAMPSMLQARCDFGAAAFDGKIYVCGGFNGVRQMCSLEVFNPITNEWSELSPMKFEKAGVALCSYMGKLWAIGGYDGQKELTNLEIYDPKTDTWSSGKSTNRPKAFGGAAVFSNLIFKKSQMTNEFKI